jgi:hypothetical protein
MEQLSLFSEYKEKKLWYKVRLSSIYQRSSEDKIFSYPTELEAKNKLQSWIDSRSGNTGFIYKESVTNWFLNRF